MTSAPIIIADLTTPLFIIAVAVLSEYMPLVQAVFKSMHAALVAPSNRCTFDAAFGHISSKVVEPNTISSTSSGCFPAAAKARAAAT